MNFKVTKLLNQPVKCRCLIFCCGILENIKYGFPNFQGVMNSEETGGPKERETRREGSSKEEMGKKRETKKISCWRWKMSSNLWVLYADPPEHSNFDLPEAPMG